MLLLAGAMATHYRTLIVWQLADEIRREVCGWTGRPPFVDERKRRTRIEDAIDSVCRNIVEGFPATHAEFARYLCIARRSLNEVGDCVRSARLKGFISPDEAARVHALANRLYPASRA